MSYEIYKKKKIRNGYFKEKLYDLRVSPLFLWIFGIEIGVILGMTLALLILWGVI